MRLISSISKVKYSPEATLFGSNTLSNLACERQASRYAQDLIRRLLKEHQNSRHILLRKSLLLIRYVLAAFLGLQTSERQKFSKYITPPPPRKLSVPISASSLSLTINFFATSSLLCAILFSKSWVAPLRRLKPHSHLNSLWRNSSSFVTFTHYTTFLTTLGSLIFTTASGLRGVKLKSLDHCSTTSGGQNTCQNLLNQLALS